jgi:hypothetical protein
MSALRPGEFIWIQYLIRPTGGDWVKEGKSVVDELTGKEKKESNPFIMKFFGFFVDIVGGLLVAAGVSEPDESEKKEEKEKEFSLAKLTPSQKGVLERVELKLGKLAFKCGIRILYAGREEVFMRSRISGITGMYKQLYDSSLNSFRPNLATLSGDKGLFSWAFPSDKGFLASSRTKEKKKKIWEKFRNRDFTDKFIILNIEELATLWHLPGINVQAPLIPRVQAKKGQPPSFLPVQ